MLTLVFFAIPFALGLLARELATGRTNINPGRRVFSGSVPQERESSDGLGWGSRRIFGAEETGHLAYKRNETIKIWTQ